MKWRELSMKTLVVAVAAALAAPAGATLVARMDLDGLVGGADKIFRGTVVDISAGTVAIGGGELPTVTYTLRVDEALKGSYDSSGTVAVTMVGDIKGSVHRQGDTVRFSALPELPRLQLGSDYVLFTTAPSAVGLSTMVGLGQGTFAIVTGPDKGEVAVNELENAGLFAGPVTYQQLVAAIRAELAN